MQKLFTLFLILLLSACSSSTDTNPSLNPDHNPISDQETMSNQTCLNTITVTNDIPYLQNLDAQSTIQALDFTAEKDSLTPLEDNIFFAIQTETGDLVANNKFFSDLVKLDATRVEEVKSLGKATPVLLEEMQPREIFQLLIETQVIQTYWHLEAEICQTSEEDTAQTYTAYYSASHEYCTNECISADYKFQLSLNKANGEIVLDL